MPKKAPILVTGTHRSGTTWVGQMLALDPHTIYIHEPFNISLQRQRGKIPPLLYWYEMVNSTNSSLVSKYVDGFQSFTLRNVLNNSFRRNAAMSAKWIRLAFDNDKRYLYKDPLALLSAPWMAREKMAQVLVLIRHPAAFSASLKVKNWAFPFADLAAQEEVMSQVPEEMRTKILQYTTDRPAIVEQAVLLWNVLHHFIRRYREEYPGWIFVRHEDLSKDPVSEFEKIYRQLGLSFSDHIKAIISRSSVGEISDNANKTNQLIRDSAANIKYWKKRLTSEEVAYIRKETADISAYFYSEDDW